MPYIYRTTQTKIPSLPLRETAFLQMLHVDALPRIHLQNAKAIDMSEEEILHNITRNESMMAQIFKLQKCIRKVHFFLSTTPYFFLNVVHCPLNLIRNSWDSKMESIIFNFEKFKINASCMWYSKNFTLIFRLPYWGHRGFTWLPLGPLELF